jgi:hypothetical protein
MGDEDTRPPAGDAGDEPAETESASGEPSADEQAFARANIEKVDEILDEAGVNEGIAAGSRETHPDEGGPRL